MRALGIQSAAVAVQEGEDLDEAVAADIRRPLLARLGLLDDFPQRFLLIPQLLLGGEGLFHFTAGIERFPRQGAWFGSHLSSLRR